MYLGITCNSKYRIRLYPQKGVRTSLDFDIITIAPFNYRVPHMQSLHDKEFGEISIRRNSKSRAIKISVAPNGSLSASIPYYAPLILLRRIIGSSRTQLRVLVEKQTPKYSLSHGMAVGKSHKLSVVSADNTEIMRTNQNIVLRLHPADNLCDIHVERLVRAEIIKALRIEAKAYLPMRIKYLSQKLGCTYGRTRFSHTGSRWGSCSSTGTISLNIALMKLPFELIDYVVIHELCHTKQMNHSPMFWDLVKAADPDYKKHRNQLKTHSPTI